MKMPPKRQVSNRLTGVSVTTKGINDESTDPKSKRVQNRKQVRTPKRSSVHRKSKFAMTSVKRRHLDQIFNDVGSGHVYGNGRTQPGIVELIDDETNTVTPVPSCEIPQSVSSPAVRNGNSVNAVALPRNGASAETEAPANNGLLSESSQSESVLNSSEIGHGNVPVGEANTGRSDAMGLNQMNEIVQDNSVLRQK